MTFSRVGKVIRSNLHLLWLQSEGIASVNRLSFFWFCLINSLLESRFLLLLLLLLLFIISPFLLPPSSFSGASLCVFEHPESGPKGGRIAEGPGAGGGGAVRAAAARWQHGPAG